ncbi:hypothetical protein [Polyangium sp. y55x31]|uniref:hypothetical protein n=1 Tax=Polyangium sp. y55x31 TaxID=3042688 RepID=UPI0024828FA0|nr:hypothetical protein [Polyangium sp. y55x31]MDI1475617.1 hypothetical protein [Polyangium sp. y55x31]
MIRIAPPPLLLALALGTVGCAYRVPPTHVPPPLAFSAADLDVDEIMIVDHDPTSVDTGTPADLWQDTVNILGDAARARPTPSGRARVRVRIDLERRSSVYDAMRKDGIAFVSLFFAPLGLVIDNEKLSVDVTVEQGGRTYEGHGSAEKLGSMYAPARRRALAVALDRALADASTKSP